MRKVSVQLVRLMVGLLLLCPVLGRTQERQLIALPPPQMEGGTPIMQALKARRSSREFSPEPLPAQILSNLLWAALALTVRSPAAVPLPPHTTGRRSISMWLPPQGSPCLTPTPMPCRRYCHRISGLSPAHRAIVPQAPVQLIYVADFARMGHATSEADKHFYAPADTGFISQNVYLYCASAGLATVVRESIDKLTLAAAMQLRPEQQIILAQSVGYPKR